MGFFGLCAFLLGFLGILPVRDTLETGVQFLIWEDQLEEGVATHSNILAWRIPGTEEPGGFRPWGHKELDMTERLSMHARLSPALDRAVLQITADHLSSPQRGPWDTGRGPCGFTVRPVLSRHPRCRTPRTDTWPAVEHFLKARCWVSVLQVKATAVSDCSPVIRSCSQAEPYRGRDKADRKPGNNPSEPEELFWFTWVLWVPDIAEGRLWDERAERASVEKLMLKEHCHCLVTRSCLTLCDPMDCSPTGSSVHRILQATILEWVAIPFSRGIFLTQGWNLGLLHWQADSSPLSHQGSLSRLVGRMLTGPGILNSCLETGLPTHGLLLLPHLLPSFCTHLEKSQPPASCPHHRPSGVLLAGQPWREAL